MRLSPLTVIALLAPWVAVAQTPTPPSDIEIKVGQTDREVVRGDRCDSNFNFTYQINRQPLTVVCTPLDVWLTTASSCEEAPPTDAEILFTLQNSGQTFTQPNGDFSFPVNSLPVFEGADGGTACGTGELEKQFRVCASFEMSGFGASGCNANTNIVVAETTPPTIGFDSRPPAVPTLDKVEPLDGEIAVAFTASGDTNRVIVTATDPDGKPFAETGVLPDNTVRISKLVNGVTYQVTAKAIDEAGNESASSPPQAAKPFLTCGIGCAIDQANPDAVGCSATGGATLGILGLLSGAFLIARRRRTWR